MLETGLYRNQAWPGSAGQPLSFFFRMKKNSAVHSVFEERARRVKHTPDLKRSLSEVKFNLVFRRLTKLPKKDQRENPKPASSKGAYIGEKAPPQKESV